MGQRHQIVIVYPEMFLNKDNCNNKPERAEVLHHQWLYGRSAILALNRALTLVKNSWDGSGPDYMFGRSDNGYVMRDGAKAIAAAVSVDPSSGYYHNVHAWEPQEWNGGIKVGQYTTEPNVIPVRTLTPDMFDNNDGITLIRFKAGQAKPSYAFITPNHLEGSHWKDSSGYGPWDAETYLRFYYDNAEMKEWPIDLVKSMAKSIVEIEQMAELMTADEVAELLPNFKIRAKRKAKRLDPEEQRIQELESEGMTRSDAQGVYDAEQMSGGSNE